MDNDKILELMEKRHKSKKKDMAKYRIIHKLIRQRIKESKKKYMADRCREIETLQIDQDVHRKVKEIRGLGKKKRCDLLKDMDGCIILDHKLKIER